MTFASVLGNQFLFADVLRAKCSERSLPKLYQHPTLRKGNPAKASLQGRTRSRLRKFTLREKNPSANFRTGFMMQSKFPLEKANSANLLCELWLLRLAYSSRWCAFARVVERKNLHDGQSRCSQGKTFFSRCADELRNWGAFLQRREQQIPNGFIHLR